MPEHDDWSTTSGFLTDYEGTIVSAGFEEGQYGCQMAFEIETDVPEKPLTKEFYRLGPDWHTLDGGDTATHLTATKFNTNTEYGQLITKAASANPDIATRGSARSADTWVGTRWYWEETSKPYKFKDDTGATVEGVKTKNYPSKFLGEGAGSTAGSGSAAVGDGDVLSGVSAGTLDMMKLQAQGLPRDEWLDKILDIDEVRKDSKLVSACADGDTIYERLKNG